MQRKDKHIRIAEPIIEVMDKYAELTMRTKTVVYEMGLKQFILQHQKEMKEAGVSHNLIFNAVGDNGQIS